MDVEIAEGDMRDAASMRRAMDGGALSLSRRRRLPPLGRAIPKRSWRNNLEGTRAVMEAARDAGVERIVYTSSVAALKPSHGVPVDETSRHTRTDPSSAPTRNPSWSPSDWWRRWRAEGLPVVLVAPSTPIGPRDVKPTPHRTHHRAGREPAGFQPSSIPGFKPRPCRRCGRRPPSRAGEGQDRRELHPGAAKMCA